MPLNYSTLHSGVFIMYWHICLNVLLGPLAPTWLSHSEGQEAASAAAPEEAGQANLLAVTWRDLKLHFTVPLQFMFPRTGNKSAVTGRSRVGLCFKPSLKRENLSVRKKTVICHNFSVNYVNKIFLWLRSVGVIGDCVIYIFFEFSSIFLSISK